MAKTKTTTHGAEVMSALDAVCDARNDDGFIDFDLFQILDGKLGEIVGHQGQWDVSIAREIAESTGLADGIRREIGSAGNMLDRRQRGLAVDYLLAALRLSLDLLLGDEEAAQIVHEMDGLL